jgi:hypothetical protein
MRERVRKRVLGSNEMKKGRRELTYLRPKRHLQYLLGRLSFFPPARPTVLTWWVSHLGVLLLFWPSLAFVCLLWPAKAVRCLASGITGLCWSSWPFVGMCWSSCAFVGLCWPSWGMLDNNTLVNSI